MAKGGKGRKGGGGGGGKTRKYSRDNKGRFASTGSGGATARGGRLKTASGNKRKTQTITATGQKGVLAKPKGLKPESTNRLKTGIFISKRRAVNAQLANKPDQAVVNIPGRFTGRAGKSFDASITRAVATVKASKDAKFKTKAEVKADQAKTKAAKEAKPKRVRSAESLRVSRAKQVEKRRSITTNPAGVRASAAAKMAANATRTQQRAAAFYKAGGKPAAAATAKPARFSASELAERKGYAKQLMAQPKGVRKANYLQRKAQKNPDQLDRFKGRMKFGTQNTINNITEGRNYLTAKKSQFANTPEKRASIERSVTNSGRSLQARMKTTNLGTRLRRLNKPVTTRAAKTKGTIGKPKGLKPGAIKPKATARIKPAAKSPKFTTEQSGRVRRAALGGGRTAIVRKNSAVIINAKGEPIMTRKGLPNITAGKKYAANPNARGPRLMGRDRSEASPSRGYIRTSKPTGTIGKPKGLKPGSIELKPAAAKPAVRRKSVGTISEAKAGRIISRIDANRPGLRRASGSARKTANAIRTQQRATDFALAASARGRKQGKNLSVNQSLQRAIKNASAKRKPRSMR